MNAIDPQSPRGELLQNWSKTLKVPPLGARYSDWQVELFGCSDCLWFPRVGKVPNAFQRLMQYLVFGNRWTRMK